MNTTNAAAFERAKRLANLALFAIQLQCRRLNASEPEDADFLFRKWYGFEFLLLALIRLRRIAEQVASLPEVVGAIAPAIAQFDAQLPGLRLMRNVSEHIDDYAFGKGRNRSVEKEMLEVSALSGNGPMLQWLETELNAQLSLEASEDLFRALQQAGNSRRPAA